jgi:hypothetical protein
MLVKLIKDYKGYQILYKSAGEERPTLLEALLFLPTRNIIDGYDIFIEDPYRRYLTGMWVEKSKDGGDNDGAY